MAKITPRTLSGFMELLPAPQHRTAFFDICRSKIDDNMFWRKGNGDGIEGCPNAFPTFFYRCIR